MPRVQNTPPIWPSISSESVNSKYEKCRNITEEIYKRINITFQIKSLETGSQSDLSCVSDQIEIDSNELSNGTDLFAYEKSDSIASSDQDKKPEKLINLNNNEIKKSVVPIYKPPRKRFRKKIKKRPLPAGGGSSEGSSDEAPLSRIVEPPREEDGGVARRGAAEGGKDYKTKPRKPEKPAPQTQPITEKTPPPTIEYTLKECTVTSKTAKGTVAVRSVKDDTGEWKNCSMCNLPCRGERGLRRHMSLSHILMPEEMTRPKTRKSTEGKTV